MNALDSAPDDRADGVDAGQPRPRTLTVLVLLVTAALVLIIVWVVRESRRFRY